MSETPQTPQEVPDEVANRPEPADVPDADIAEPLPDEPGQQEDEADEPGPAQGSGERPAHPAQGTRPPGNEEADPARVEQAREDLDRTGAN